MLSRTARACLGVLLCLAAVSSSDGQGSRGGVDAEAQDYLGTPRSEEAIRRGLEWLASKQLPSGNWESGPYRDDAAVAGLCVMAFLASGHEPGRGRYGALVEKAVDWLAESVQRNGLVARGGSAGPPMYGHGFATLALAELYGMTKRTDLLPKLQSAVELICATQNREGGWRYQPQAADADISVTAVQVMALRAAHNAGIPVPADTVKRAVGYIKKCANNPDGGFSYQANIRGSGPARTGAAITCLILSGERKAPEVQAGLRYLREHPMDRYEWMYRQHYFYALYYCTQAFYQVGGEPWRAWFAPLRDRLVEQQRRDGSWTDSPGEAYATAMAILTLQVPAGLLPIYQK